MSPISHYLSVPKSNFDGNARLTQLATAVVLVIGLSGSAAGFFWQKDDLSARAQARFDQQVERIEADVEHDLNRPFSGLKGAAGVYAASISVERAEFRAFVESSKVDLDYPGIRGFGFIERVKSGDVDAFVAAQRRDESPDFSVKTQGHGDVLYITKFIEPAEPNRAALGFNLANDPVRKQAVERAIMTGEPTLSGPIQLVTDVHQRPAVLFLLPVYRQGAPVATVPQRQAALVGVLAAPVVLEEILVNLVASAKGQTRLALYDGLDASAATPGNLLFDLKGAAGPADAAPMFQTTRVVVVGGRPLTLRMATTPAFEAQAGSWVPVLLALAGVLLSSLMAFSIWLLGSGRARALALAQRMTADLAQERERLVDIVEGTNMGTWVWHVQTGALQLDAQWAAILGYTLEELGPQNMDTWRERIPPEEVPHVMSLLKQHFLGKTAFFECENRIRHRDGHWLWVLARGKVSVFTPDGKPELMSGTYMDISDRQAVQSALRASEENFRHLFESSLHGILQGMPDGSIEYANPAACRLFGLSQDEIRQRGRDGLVDPQDSRCHIFLAQALMSGQARAEITMLRGDGSHFECELSLTSYLNQRGQTCTNIFLHDVTQRKRAEAEISELNRELEHKVHRRTAQLEAANQELEAFSYSVAHDLRSPLSSIDGFSRLLEKAVSADTGQNVGHYLSRIRAGVRQMGELTDGLLALAHIARASLKADTVNLSAIAGRVVELCQERDAERVVRVNVEPGLVAVGDTVLLRQVIDNLIGNAWKFTANAEAPEIWFGKIPDDNPQLTTFFIRDNGAGFDMAYVDKLFGTFQRLHSPAEFSGTGIGLATSHRIISRHGGRIWAEGAVGQGATFFFTLPCAH
ncbi:PAS domain S-box-containing protein [Polaromonas sp. CG_9.5]|uniref:CHASE domain-containing protein n=1 Tax=Polaromonas sp. CG_9.5 TaxID=3071705 RepID=UPI002DFA4DB3|nr:PAS domain S-box-containing protein [Polaromonas sp. CG_9.5]